MNKKRYTQIRNTIRQDGLRYAIRWLEPEEVPVINRLLKAQESTDALAERAYIIDFCKRDGLHCTPRNTASNDVLMRFSRRPV